MQTNFGILWDLDGVLVDTGELHFQSWVAVFRELEIPFSRDFFQSTFGMNNTGVLTALLGERATPEFVARVGGRKEELFRQMIPGRIKTSPGAREWLERFRSWGVPQAVASSAPPANIDAMIDELNLRPYFQAIVSGLDLPSKPDPAVFLEAARLIDVPPQQCVVFEDAVAGVEAARRGGMRCVAVTTTNPAEALQAADIVVERLDQLTEKAFLALVNGQPMS